MTILPLLARGAHRNLTAITLIAQAVSQYSDFPWGGLYKENAAIASEFKAYIVILKEVKNDIYAGYKYTGASKAVPILSYLSIQLMMKLGGQSSLSNYRGVGSKDTMIPNKTKWDHLNESSMNDRTAGFNYEHLQELTGESKGLLSNLGITSLINSLQSQTDEGSGSRKRALDEDSNDTDDSDSDDSNHPDSPPLGGPGEGKQPAGPPQRKEKEDKSYS